MTQTITPRVRNLMNRGTCRHTKLLSSYLDMEPPANVGSHLPIGELARHSAYLELENTAQLSWGTDHDYGVICVTTRDGKEAIMSRCLNRAMRSVG